MDLEFARAAKTVIVTAEEIVTTEEIARSADRTIVPGFLVDAVVEVPFGAYPARVLWALRGGLRPLRRVRRPCNRPGADGVEEYLRSNVDEPAASPDCSNSSVRPTLLEQRRRARELVTA